MVVAYRVALSRCGAQAANVARPAFSIYTGPVERRSSESWNPLQYQRFRKQRALPFHDLLELIDYNALPSGTGPLHAVDLGCGTGALTAQLHDRLVEKSASEVITLGIDNSPAMLAQSAEHAKAGLSFELSAIEDYEPAVPQDLVFSNAALQWVGDHELLFARLALMLSTVGQLAVQMPANFDHPSQLAALDVAQLPPFREELEGFARHSPVRPPEWYATLLYKLGFHAQHVRLQVYTHLLDSRDDVVEWVKGTLLTAYAERLEPEQYDNFVEAYRERLHQLLPDTHPYFYTFKRLHIWARR